MRLVGIAICAALAGASGYAFVTRYWLFRDCIAAAQSSCITPGGDNLTSGGMLWGVVALAFCAAAFALIMRKTAKG